MVVAEAKSMADLLMLNEALHLEEKKIELACPDDWQTIWLPQLVFTDVVIKQLARGTNISIFIEAKKIVEDKKARGIKPSLPWST